MKIPKDLYPSGRTNAFTAATTPAKLRSRHSTKVGTWGQLNVSKGRLRLRLHDPINEEQVLDPSSPGVIPPEVEHDVEPLEEDTEFYIEFFRGDGELGG